MKIVYIILILCTSFAYTQENKRWFSLADIDVIFPSKDKTTYSYSDIPNTGLSYSKANLTEKVAYGFNYSFNYRFWGGLSIGAVTGFSHLPLNEASLTTMKLGGELRYTFVEEYKASIYLQIVGFIPLRNNIDADFGDIRLGVTIPISQGEDYNFTLGIYTANMSYYLNKPLFYNETPDLVDYRGFGISLGIQF